MIPAPWDNLILAAALILTGGVGLGTLATALKARHERTRFRKAIPDLSRALAGESASELPAFGWAEVLNTLCDAGCSLEEAKRRIQVFREIWQEGNRTYVRCLPVAPGRTPSGRRETPGR